MSIELKKVDTTYWECMLTFFNLNTITTCKKNGLYRGWYYGWYNKQLGEEFTFKDDKKDGLYRYWYE